MAPPRVKSDTPAPSKPRSNPFGMAVSKGSMPTPGVSAAKPETRREITRRQFFDNRKDITDERLDRRQKQADEYRAFKSDPTKTKLVGGTTNLYQAATPGGITLADKQIQLANKYGPTFSEIMSDVTYAGGKVLGALGERAMSGGLGFLGVIKDVANYALNKANQGYDKLNSVQQEIFDNPDKYPYASKVPQVEAVNNSRLLALEAMRDANSYAADATGILGVDTNRLDGFVNEPMDTFSGATMGPKVDMRRPTEEELDPMDIGYVESGQFKEDLQKSGILTVDDPATGEPLADSTKIPGTNTTLGDLKEELKKQNYNDFQITGIINEMTQRIISGEDVNAPIENIGEPEKSDDQVSSIEDLTSSEIAMYKDFTPNQLERFNEKVSEGMTPREALAYEANVNFPYYRANHPEAFELYLETFPEMFERNKLYQENKDDQASLSTDDGTQVTAYNNPGNLQFAGQQGAIEGQTYGNNFAVFPNAEAGISALKNDLLAKVNRSNKVDDIIGQYASGDPNVPNYIEFVKNTVGETVEPNELDDLTRSVIQFENKPSIANQYLTMVADGGMIDKQLKNLQNGLQNMYNGIPSVKRR